MLTDSMASAEKLTPMMKQYQGIRRRLPEDVLLFFRLGDFYELFFDDAKTAAGILNVALTKRHNTPMCGVPYHAAENYIAKLIKANKRVAICDQISEPQPGKIVEREVTQIVTAGTIDDLNLLEGSMPNYLAAVNAEKSSFGIAVIDLSAGDFRVIELHSREEFEQELSRLAPTELIYRDDQVELFEKLPASLAYDAYPFLFDQAEYVLRNHFRVQSLDGFGCGDCPVAVGAAGAVLHYLENQLRRKLDAVRSLRRYHRTDYLILDPVTQSNLELISSRGSKDNTLLKALDRTVTPMGGRLLREWLLHPLRNLERLQHRQQFIADLLEEPFLLAEMRESLKPVRDIQRTIGRLSQSTGNARDMQSLKTSLEQIPELQEHLSVLLRRLVDDEEDKNSASPLAQETLDGLVLLPELVELLESALTEEPPAALKEGGIFKDGYNSELDSFRQGSRDGKDWIARLQAEEIKRTGIKNLKVRFNSVFGYYIEITKANLESVPDDYIRKQTMANAERFITPELKEMESKILGADEKSRQLEYELFLQLRDRVLTWTDDLQSLANAVATLDCVASLAEIARHYRYVRPVLDTDRGVTEIVDGRHPVLDQNLVEEKFVPNDAHLNLEDRCLSIITGPNMAGKSTFIRQVALISIMAQMGSWVPAREARLSLVDRIFTRVGASDDISRGQSTFMVEMNETANIINSATGNSLVILDEIGRGTATYDGLSIAWSVAEHLLTEIGARTLFATHYHELTHLAARYPGVCNLNVAVREWNDQIIFLRKIVEGAADRSYGIQVAQLAGLPPSVIARAKHILARLESGAGLDFDDDTQAASMGGEQSGKMPKQRTKKVSPRVEDKAPQDVQLSFFEN